jgi:hypothetical protein
VKEPPAPGVRRGGALLACYFLVLAVSLAFSGFLRANGVIDPFLYVDVAHTRLAAESGALAVPETGPFSSLNLVLGRQMLMLQFANMLGIEPETLLYLPLGAILVSSTMFLLGVWLLRSLLAATLATLTLTLNLSHAAALYSVFAYALALPLFLAGVRFGARFVSTRAPNYLALFMVVFVAANFVHYTLTMWMVVLMLAVATLISSASWTQRRVESNARQLSPWPLAFALLVFYLYFNNTFYSSFIPLAGPETLGGAIDRFFSFLSLGDQVVARSPHVYTRDTSIGVVTSLALLILVLPTLLGTVVVIDRWVRLKRRLPALDPQLLMTLALVAVTAADVLVYSVRGSITTKSISMLLPLAAAHLVSLRSRRWMQLLLAASLLLSVAKIAVFANSDFVIGRGSAVLPERSVEQVEEWLHTTLAGGGTTIVADLGVYGQVLLEGVRHGRVWSVRGFSLPLLEDLIDDSRTDVLESGVPIAIDERSRAPVMGFEWVRLNPLSDYLHVIRANRTLSRVFSDGRITIALPTEPLNAVR